MRKYDWNEGKLREAVANCINYRDVLKYLGVPTTGNNSTTLKKRIERFGIDKFAEVKVGNLSTGMKQKVSLVISIVHDPDIIIFDEPTNGLDILTAKVVTDFLEDLKERGKTIILSTHIFSLVEKLCTRVAIVINGKLTVCDSLENLTKDMSLENKFFEIYEEVAGDYNA